MTRPLLPSARRFRRVLLALAVAWAALGGYCFATTPAVLNWATGVECDIRGYHGCLCTSCRAAFLSSPDPWGNDQIVLPLPSSIGIADRASLGWRAVLSSLVLLCGSTVGVRRYNRFLIVRARRVGRCAWCGYEIGVVGSTRCPECGRDLP